jgi:hypothetical protein
MQNKTTVEYHEGVTAHEHYQRQGQSFRHPYDVGAKENVRQVLGPRAVLWLVPGIAAAGDGVRFPDCLPLHMRGDMAGARQGGAVNGATVQLTDRNRRETYADTLQ